MKRSKSKLSYLRQITYFLWVLHGLSGGVSATENTSFRFSLSHGTDDLSYVSPALSATSDQFFSGGIWAGVNIGGGTLSSGSSIAFSNQFNRMTSLSVVMEKPLSPRLMWVSALSISSGQSRFFLPNGSGVLVQPITIRFAHQSIGLETGISRQIAKGKRLVTRASIGFGGVVTQTNTAISSALLNVRNTSIYGDTYVYLGVETGLERAGRIPAMMLETRLKKYSRTGLVLQAGLKFSY